jgi:zinc protease
MKKYISLFVVCFLSTLHVSAIEIVKLPLPNSDKYVVKLMFRNGSITDPQGKDGLTQLTATLMMDGGTGKMTGSQIRETTYPWAARWSESVDKEVCIFTFEFHKDHKSVFLPILSGLVVNPSFDVSDFNRIKSNQENYVNELIRASSDEDFSKMSLEDLLFRGTNYQHMVSGTTSGLKAITLDDVKAQHKKYFTSANLTIGIAGNLDDGFVDLVLAEMNKLSKTIPAIPLAGKANEPSGIEVEIIAKNKALGSAIFAGFPLPVTRKDDEFAALMVANSWLGEHRKSYSRLYQKIREQRSMNYGDYTYIEWYESGGSNMLPVPGFPRSSNYFSIWLRPVQTAAALKGQYPELGDIQIGHAHFALRMALREMQNLIDNGMSKEDFELTRNFLKSYMKLYVQTPSRQLGFLMDSKFYDRKDYIKEMDDLLSQVTISEVNEVMKKYWQTESMFITVVTDKSEADPLSKSFLENAVSPMSYSKTLKETLPAKILEEDEVVAGYPMKVTKVNIVSDQSIFR